MTREAIVARGRRLECVTVAWNLLEALVALVSGFVAGSVALVGFGLDSVVEASSGAVLLWRLQGDPHSETRERREHLALRLVGICFLLLAAYVAFDAGKGLIRREAPGKSVPGVLLAVASLIIMPLLARAKRAVARQIESSAMEADSHQADFCAYLSAILLLGLALNNILGWWWADPVAALVMVPLIAKEGIEAVRGKTCSGSETCAVDGAAGAATR